MQYTIDLTTAQYKRAMKLLHEAVTTSILNKKPTATIKANKALIEKFEADFKKVKAINSSKEKEGQNNA